jgi:hypothetical protein
MTAHFVTRCGNSAARGVTHHVAYVVRNEGNFLDSKLVQHGSEVSSPCELFVAAFGMGRQTHATQVWNDDGMVFNQRIGKRHPHIS